MAAEACAREAAEQHRGHDGAPQAQRARNHFNEILRDVQGCARIEGISRLITMCLRATNANLYRTKAGWVGLPQVETFVRTGWEGMRLDAPPNETEIWQVILTASHPRRGRRFEPYEDKNGKSLRDTRFLEDALAAARERKQLEDKWAHEAHEAAAASARNMMALALNAGTAAATGWGLAGGWEQEAAAKEDPWLGMTGRDTARNTFDARAHAGNMPRRGSRDSHGVRVRGHRGGTGRGWTSRR